MKPTVIFKAEATKAGILLPKSIKLPSGSRTAIEGLVGSLPFQTKVGPDRKLKLKYNTKDIETISIEIMRIGDELETRVPRDLSKALSTKPKALKLWNDITPIARRDWIYWMCSGKLLETRKHRIEVACSKLTAGKRRVCCFGGINWLMKTSK